MAEARVHDPNDDDVITRAGKAASALRYAVDLSADMRDLAYEQVKAGLAEAERAARLADDMVAAVRDLHDPDPRGYCIACGWRFPCATRNMVDDFVPQQEPQPDAYSAEGRRAAQDRHVDDFMRRADHARQQEEAFCDAYAMDAEGYTPPRRISAEPPGWEGTRATHERASAALSPASLTPDQQAALAQLCRDLEARYSASATSAYRTTDALNDWHSAVAAGYYRHAQPLTRPRADYRGLVATLAILAAIAIAVAVWWP